MYMKCMKFLTFMLLTILLSSHAFTSYHCEFSEVNESRECSEKSEKENNEKFEKEIVLAKEYQDSFQSFVYAKGFFLEPNFHISDVFYDILIPPPDLA